MGCFSGAVGTGRSRAAGAGRRVIAGWERTTVPGVKGASCPVVACSCATRQPRWGPDAGWWSGRPTVRKVQLPSGRRMTQQANADGRNGGRKPGTAGPAPPPDGSRRTGWIRADTRRVLEDVQRLRQRIFTATQAGYLKKVRNLQKLMLRSRANALRSVRRVTER